MRAPPHTTLAGAAGSRQCCRETLHQGLGLALAGVPNHGLRLTMRRHFVVDLWRLEAHPTNTNKHPRDVIRTHGRCDSSDSRRAQASCRSIAGCRGSTDMHTRSSGLDKHLVAYQTFSASQRTQVRPCCSTRRMAVDISRLALLLAQACWSWVKKSVACASSDMCERRTKPGRAS